MPLRLFPADRIAFQYSGPGEAIIVPEITAFVIYLDEACTTLAPIYDLNGVLIQDSSVDTDANGLLDEFQVEDVTRVWGRPQVLGADAYPMDAAFGPRITEIESRPTASSGMGLPTFIMGGLLAPKVGTGRIYNDTGRDVDLGILRASVENTPAGRPVVVDFLMDGVSLGLPLSIEPGAVTVTAQANLEWPDGSYLSVDVVQVGDVYPGFTLTVSASAV